MKRVKLFEQFIAEAKGLDWVISQLGDKPSCYKVASFVYDNYDKVTGLRKSMRNDEMDFPEEIMDVVDNYGLDIDEFTDCYGMAAESFNESLNEAKFKVGDKWEWHHVDGVKTVEITNVKSNGDVVGREDGSSEDFIVRDANKYLKKKVNEASTWKTRDGLGINNITGKSINPEVKKIIKSKNTLDGKEGKILVDTEGNIAFFENPTVAQEVADLVGGTIVNKIETKDGLTHSASSRGGSMVILESTINEAKTLTRDELIKILKDKYSLHFTKTSEEFDGEEGGIWIGGSEGKVMPDGKTEMFNYYHGGSKFPQGINKDFANFLDKRGWYGQFADPGTVLLWPR